MAVVEDYIRENNKKYRKTTSRIESNYVYINKSDFVNILGNFYCAGYIKCYKNTKDKYKKFVNSSTRQGGYNMDTNRVLERIENLGEKLDTKTDRIDGKLDKLNDNLNELNREVGEIKTKVDSIDKKNSFWTVYIIAPIITSIVTTILVSIISK